MAQEGVSSQARVASELEVRLRKWSIGLGGFLLAMLCLYIFLLGLALLGDAFKCLGGKGTGEMFSAVNDPIAGLMTGVLGTVLVQSSSTSTSIVVGLVGASQVSVKSAIPMIMGANIGTSVTSTIVSMGQSGDRIQLHRAFAGATVHDMFNMLSVATMLPLELFVGALQGEGGPLYWITKVIADAAMSGQKGSNPLADASPIKIITKPVAALVIKNNKYVIKALSLGAPVAQEPTQVSTKCLPLGSQSNVSSSGGNADCSHFFCVSAELDKNFKKISKSAYSAELTKCEGFVVAPAEPCSAGGVCYLDAGAFYQSHVKEKQVIKGGFLEGAGDLVGGIIALVLALGLLTGGLFGLVKTLHQLLIGRAKGWIMRATRLNDYLALAIGVAITIIVQSSSVTTSALTPLCGLGLLPLVKMLPLTLGANIGTTMTALLAALYVFTHDAIHIALCHLFFNIFGILIWFPVPFMRRVPLEAASLLGLYASFYRAVPLYYILTAFVIVPGICLGLSRLFGATLLGGVFLLLVLVFALGCFLLWWVRWGGCYKVLSEDSRAEGRLALKQADCAVRGEQEMNAESDEVGTGVAEQTV